MLIPLLVFTTLLATCTFGTRPAAVYHILALGGGAADIGLMASAFAALAIVGAIPTGRAVDVVGPKPLMITGAVVCAATSVAIPFVDAIPGVMASQALLGGGQMMCAIAAQTMLGNQGEAERREFRFGMYTSAASLGHAIGPGVAGILVGAGAGGMRLSFLLFAIVGALAAVIAATLSGGGGARSAASADAAGRDTIVRTLRRPGMLPALSVGIIAFAAADLVTAYLPLYGVERGIAPPMIGAMLATLALAQMASRLTLPALVKRFTTTTILSGSVLVAAATVPLILLPAPEPVRIFIAGVTGLGLGLALPLTLVLVAGIAPIESRGQALGIRLLGNRSGQFVVPAALGATAGQLGVGAIVLSASAMLLIAGAIVWFARARLWAFDKPARLASAEEARTVAGISGSDTEL